MSTLSDKQARFVEEYLKDLNATEAAKRAGYAPRSAEVQGHRLLRNDKVATEIDKGRKQQSERNQITADMVMHGLFQEATATGEGTSHSARVSAWSQLGKFIGLAERTEVTGRDGAPIPVQFVAPDQYREDEWETQHGSSE
jgi:phage terminase small subunit